MLLGVTLLLLLASNPSAAEPQGDKEKLVCKREVPVGSLIASRKVCMTKSQRESRARDGNDEARNQAYNNMGRPACNDSSSC